MQLYKRYIIIVYCVQIFERCKIIPKEKICILKNSSLRDGKLFFGLLVVSNFHFKYATTSLFTFWREPQSFSLSIYISLSLNHSHCACRSNSLFTACQIGNWFLFSCTKSTLFDLNIWVLV